MKLVALLTALVALTTGAPADNEQRVSSGSSEPTAIPYLVSIYVKGKYTCGGFIYGINWIVTAASCLGDALPSEVKVIVGDNSVIIMEPDEEIISVFEIYIYDYLGEVYDPVNKLHDIALLELAKLITISDKVAPIPYEEVEPTAAGTFSGWGTTQEGGAASVKLRTIEMTIPATCGTYTAEEYNPKFMFCAGDSTTDTGSPCQYDEGSPFVQTIGSTKYAVGIMSKNKGCAADFEPTIFTRLTSYYVWLYKIAGMQTSP